MAWSQALQAEKERLLACLIEQCRREVGSSRTVNAQTDPCSHLGICEEDLDDIQIESAAHFGLRLPFPGEGLVAPWHGPGIKMTLDDLAGWLAVNCRPNSD